MKAILLGVSTAIVAVTSMAAPAGATFLNTNPGNSSGYIGGNAGMSSSSYSRIGIKDGKIIFEGESVMCMKGNFIMGGLYTKDQNVNKSTPTLPSADTTNCNPAETVNNPPANSTVTINGFCDEDAAKLKATVNGTNVTVIVNGTGPCDKDDKTPGTIGVIDTPKPDTTTPTVKAASAVTTDPKGGAGSVDSLPQTGSNEVIAAVVASILAGTTYGGAMIIRAIRARG